MRHARYVGPAGTGRFCVFVWFGLVRVGLEHAVQRRVPAPRDLPEHLAMKVRPRPVRVPAARLRRSMTAAHPGHAEPISAA